MILSKVTELCNRHHDPILEPLCHTFLSLTLTTTNLLAVSTHLPSLDISYKHNHTIYDFCNWFISLSILRVISVAAGFSTSFLLMAE